jgi:hypothetical protein
MSSQNKLDNKVMLLLKRVQDRKTQEIFEDENEKISGDEVTDILEISQQQQGFVTSDETITISFLLTMKNIAHTITSKARWKKFCEDNNVQDLIYTFSSRGDFTSVRDITDLISLGANEAPKHIVACTHIARMKNILEISRFLERRNPEWRKERRLRIYLDEFDEYADEMRGIVEELAAMNCVEQIVIVTASARLVWCNRPGWKSLYVLNPRILDAEGTYLMFKDCKHVDTGSLHAVEIHPVIDLVPTTDRGTIELLTLHRRIIDKYPDILKPGRVLFVPGCILRRSHEDVAMFWNSFGCSAFVFNGERTIDGFYGKLYLPDRTVIDIPHLRLDQLESSEMKTHLKGIGDMSNSAQLNEIIADYIFRHSLFSTPIAITGLLCIERAQTLMHPVWGTFTDAIFNGACSPEKAYQLQRQLGHVRKWDTFRGIPRVFSPETFRRDVLILESRADEFGRKFGGNRATLDDYVASGTDALLTSKEKKLKNSEETKRIISNIVQHPTPFKTISDVNKFLAEKTKRSVNVKPFHRVDGYELSTRLNSILKKKKKELTAEDRLTTAKLDRISIGQNISANKGQPYMVYPVYPTMNSPSDEVMYIVRYIPANV